MTGLHPASFFIACQVSSWWLQQTCGYACRQTLFTRGRLTQTCLHRQTHRQTNTLTDRQAGRQAGMQTQAYGMQVSDNPPHKKLCKRVQADRHIHVIDGSIFQVDAGCWDHSASHALVLCLLDCADSCRTVGAGIG